MKLVCMLMPSSTPNQIRSMPSASAGPASSGTMMKASSKKSRKKASTKTTALTTIRKPTWPPGRRDQQVLDPFVPVDAVEGQREDARADQDEDDEGRELGRRLRAPGASGRSSAAAARWRAPARRPRPWRRLRSAWRCPGRSCRARGRSGSAAAEGRRRSSRPRPTIGFEGARNSEKARADERRAWRARRPIRRRARGATSSSQSSAALGDRRKRCRAFDQAPCRPARPRTSDADEQQDRRRSVQTMRGAKRSRPR